MKFEVIRKLEALLLPQVKLENDQSTHRSTDR